jgi:hypothetical protein
MKNIWFLIVAVYTVLPTKADTITWTQASEELVSGWTVEQCWDSRACTSSNVSVKSVTVATPHGRWLDVTITPVAINSANSVQSGAAEYIKTTPNPILGIAFAPSGVSVTSISNIGGEVTDLSVDTTDWVHWGTTTNSKSGGTLISRTVFGVNAPSIITATTSVAARPGLSWTSGGTPTASSTKLSQVTKVSTGGLGVGLGFTVASSATVQRVVDIWVRTQDCTADVSVTLNGSTQTVSVGNRVLDNGENIDYYKVTAYILGAGTADIRIVQTTSAGIGVAISGANVK